MHQIEFCFMRMLHWASMFDQCNVCGSCSFFFQLHLYDRDVHFWLSSVPCFFILFSFDPYLTPVFKEIQKYLYKLLLLKIDWLLITCMWGKSGGVFYFMRWVGMERKCDLDDGHIGKFPVGFRFIYINVNEAKDGSEGVFNCFVLVHPPNLWSEHDPRYFWTNYRALYWSINWLVPVWKHPGNIWFHVGFFCLFVFAFFVLFTCSQHISGMCCLWVKNQNPNYSATSCCCQAEGPWQAGFDTSLKISLGWINIKYWHQTWIFFFEVTGFHRKVWWTVASLPSRVPSFTRR